MAACHLGCGCGKHKGAFERLRQQQLTAQQLPDDQLTPKALHQRQQYRRYRAAKGSSARGGGNHMATPSESFDWDRAITGFRRILAEVYGDDDLSEMR